MAHIATNALKKIIPELKHNLVSLYVWDS